ncbi:MAG: MBL fold metallo-hydrolase [Cyclobacteriaceae bacterium]
MYKVIDLHFQGFESAIAAFLIESTDGPVLIETGPYSTFSSLEGGLALHGYKVSDVKHVLLSHIHFDHAGAAWAFAKEGAAIYLHPFGVDHMHDPTKLVASATMIYGDKMDELWGRMEGIEMENLKAMKPDQKVKIGGEQFIALHTPGHAKHHIAWQWGETIFAGDLAGVKINGGPVVPPCPPPDINLEDWNNSIDYVLSKKPSSLVLTHFGAEKDPSGHMREMKEVLNNWAFWMKVKWESGFTNEEITPQFMEYTANQLRERGVSEIGIQQYEAANPSWMSVAGLVRYWKKKGQN